MRDGSVTSDALDVAYMERRREQRRREIDAYVARQLGSAPADATAAPQPVPSENGSPPPDTEGISTGEEIKRGLARGGAGVLGAVGTGVRVAGLVTRNAAAREAGERIAQHWAEQAAKFPRSKAAQGNLWDDPSLLLSPHWMAASVAETAPSLLASMVPGAGAARFVQIGGKALRWTPTLALKLARIGAAVTPARAAAVAGGSAAGGLEAASTFDYVKSRGGTDEEAVRAYALMGLASAGLNAVQFARMFNPGTVGRKLAEGGGVEAVTEWLESPTEAAIVGDDVLQAMKQGLNVVPAAALTGGLASGAASMMTRRVPGEAGASDAVPPPDAAKSEPAIPGPEPVAPGVMSGFDLSQGAQPAASELSVSDLKTKEQRTEFYRSVLDAGQTLNQETGTRFVDATGELPSELSQEIANHETVKNIDAAVSKVVNETWGRLSEKFSRELGLPPTYQGLAASTNWLGINIWETDFAKGNSILLDPFFHVQKAEEALQLGRITDAERSSYAAKQMVATAIHEITHERDRGHGEVFKSKLSEYTAEIVDLVDGFEEEILSGGFRDGYQDILTFGQRINQSAPGRTNLLGALGSTREGGEVPGGTGSVAEGGGEARAPGGPDIAGGAGAGGVATPGTELRVNLANVDPAVAMTRVRAMLEENAKRISHERTIGESAGSMTVEEMLSIEQDAPLNRAQATHLRDTALAAIDDLHEIARKVNDGDAEAEANLAAAFVQAARLATSAKLAGSTTARTLEAHKIPADAKRRAQAFAEMADEVARTSETVDPRTLAQMVTDLPTKTQREKFITRLFAGIQRGHGMLSEAYINGLVSSPQTLLGVNPISNTGMLFWGINERLLQSLVPGHTVARGEAAAMTRAPIDAFGEALRVAGHVWRTEKEIGGASKMDREPAITSQNAGLDPDSGAGRAFDFLGWTIRTAGRSLMTTDAFFKTMMYRQEIAARAVRRATAEANAADRAGKPWNDGEYEKRIAEYKVNYSDEVSEDAWDFARRQTLQSDLGPLGSGTQDLINRASPYTLGFSRVLVPFVRIATNSMSWSADRTPILNLLKAAGEYKMESGILYDLANGKGPQRDLAAAKLATSAMVAALAAQLVTKGLITGGGPKDRELKKFKKDTTNWRPYAIHVGDEYYELNRIDPFFAPIFIVADFVEIAGQLPEKDIIPLTTAATLAVSRNIMSKTWLMTFSNAVEAFENPDRRGQAFIGGLIRGTVPGFVRAIERKLDPPLRDARDIMDHARAGIPGYSDDLPVTRNLFGDPVLYPPGLGPDMISPVYVSKEKKDPVAEEILNQGVRLSMPDRVIEGSTPQLVKMSDPSLKAGILLTPEQYEQYVILAGNGLKVPAEDFGLDREDSLGMHDALALIFQDKIDLTGGGVYYSQLRDGSDGSKAAVITDVVSKYRELARKKLIADDPELSLKVSDLRMARRVARSPRTLEMSP